MLLQHTVTHQAEQHPDAMAVTFKNQSVTYGELEGRSTQLAQLLASIGCKKGDRIGLLVPKSIAAIVGMLGVLKAGCVYVPMDKASPPVRLAKIIDSAEPTCILATNQTAKLLSASILESQTGGAFRLVCLEGRKPEGFTNCLSYDDLLRMPTFPVASGARAEDPAHILFTSGSTGTPKGVVITHENVLSFLTWANGYFQTDRTDHISCHPPLHFDLSTFDIWGTFLAGAQLHLVPHEISLLPNKMAEFIRSAELTQWFSVPSALKYMAQFDVIRFNDFQSLKRLLWCGEVLPTPTLMYLMKRLPHVRFTNLYGPTETTIASSYYTMKSCPENENAPIPIGRACGGEELHVLNETLQPAGLGVTGDLYISGTGLSPGYWRDAGRTKAVFLDHPQRGRIYKTGDLARIGDDGFIYLLGRVDSQVKSRGYRIELGEIETALHSLHVLQECAVVATSTDGFEGTVICCAYVPKPRTAVSHSDLRQRLAGILPPYMLPSLWLALTKLPLNANGKTDRTQLINEFKHLRLAAGAAGVVQSLSSNNVLGTDGSSLGPSVVVQSDALSRSKTHGG
jgi:amino acid adenylation domain-containing protein